MTFKITKKNKRRPQIGDKRIIKKFAWTPTLVFGPVWTHVHEYNLAHVVWLSSYVEHQVYVSKWTGETFIEKWKTFNRLINKF